MIMARRIFLLFFIVLFSVGGLFAQSNNIRFDRISIEKGLSQSTVNAIFQDKRGFMWLGTQDGLNMYDGYNFKVFKYDGNDPASLSENFVHAILEDTHGNLWIGTEGGLNLYDRNNNTFKHFLHNDKNPQSISSNRIRCIYQDRQGTLWIGTEDGLNKTIIDSTDKKNLKLKFSVYRSGSSENSLSDNFINTILEDYKQNLWIGTEKGGLVRFNREKNEFISYKHDDSNPNAIPDDKINVIYEDNEKSLWIGTANGLSLYDRGHKNFHNIFSNGTLFSLPNNIIRALWQDRTGFFWIGTEGGGLCKYDKVKHRFITYHNIGGNTNSLSNNNVYSIFEDRTGTMWIGTNVGINKFDLNKQNFYTYQASSNAKSVSSNIVWSIYEDGDVVWLGTDAGINRFDRNDGTFHDFPLPKQFVKDGNTNVYSLAKDPNGKILVGAYSGILEFDPVKGSFDWLRSYDRKSNELNNKRGYTIFFDKNKNYWFGTREGLLYMDANRSSFTYYKNDFADGSSISNNIIRDIYQSSDGSIWIGTNGGGLNKVVIDEDGNKRFKNYRAEPGKKDGLNNDIILSLFDDGKGSLWIGTYGGGLNRMDLKSGTFTHYTEKDGLPNNVIYGILPDNENNLWLSTNRGLSKFNITSQKFSNYFESDGLQSNEFNIGAYFRGTKGDLYFGGINGFNVFNPARIRTNSFAPDVVITDFLLFNKTVKVGNESVLKQNVTDTKEIFLNYKDNVFSIEFAALHYSNSDKNQYAYMLEGFDEDWNYIGNRRVAPFTKLDPGNYLFKVKASNSDGVWSNKITELRITIKPPFWKTWWFRIAAFIAIAVAFFVWYQNRINSIVEQKRELERLVAERTIKIKNQHDELEHKSSLLEVEKEKVEKLLLNILPQETVDELKTKGKASARHYRMASVMFTDFKGFTKIAEKLRPQDLVRELDSYFIKFDEIIAKYNIEKIKTIGDAYMCVGGLPIRNKSNPVDIVLAALEIQRYMKELMEEKAGKGEPTWELRIGVHTGELIAGVVGIKRFAYDVWGDTVNTASRVEASCEVGKVNVSGATYAVAKEFFVCTYRGKIQAKNKGEIDMYYIERIKPELSIDGLGIEPNEAFNDRIEHVLYSKINYKKAEQHIIKLLSENLPEGLFYHGLHHTLDVCEAAERLAVLEGVEGEDLHILKSAALFHDSGFTKEYVKNEPIGCELARATLPQFGYSEKQIQEVEKMIMATQVPQKATTLLEKIICDADLDYLGRDDFHPIADTLKRELISFGKISSDKQWDEIQVSFLTQHKYFTDSAIKLRQAKKEHHVEEIKARLASYSKDGEEKKS